jgi:hypothetical protein
VWCYEKKKMITAYLTTTGLIGIALAFASSKYFFGRRGFSDRYYRPISLTDKIVRSYLIYGLPICVALCGVSGLGVHIATLIQHYHGPTVSSPSTTSTVEGLRDMYNAILSSYFFKYYVLAPCVVGTYSLFASFGVVIIDHEQSGPAAGICPLMAGFITTCVSAGIMIWTSMRFENPEMSALYWSFVLTGPITFLSILWGRGCASD